jgi:hypothetical protein
MYIFKRTTLLFLLPLITLSITFFIYYKTKHYSDENDDASFPCYRPNDSNPLMNILVSDYGDNVTRKKSCEIDHVKKDIQKYAEQRAKEIKYLEHRKYFVECLNNKVIVLVEGAASI